MIPSRPHLSLFSLLIVILLLAACSQTQLPELTPDEVETAGVELTQAPVIHGSRGRGIQDQYIVVFKDNVRDVPGLARSLVKTHGGTLLHVYQHTIKGFAAAHLPLQAVEALRRNPNVAYIEQDGFVYMEVTQPSATWGLDRVDQRGLPLSTSYDYDADGTGVNVYVIDSGILYAHDEFAGRASLGMDFVGDGVGAAAGDCDGHGTHVAGTIGGSTYGVAKKVNLYSVRIFGCGTSSPRSRTIAAVDWVTANGVKPAVVNMSLGGNNEGYPELSGLDQAVEASIAAGFVYAVAAGNNYNLDACRKTPARAPSALTVGSSTQSDAKSDFSNIGSCLDLFAPGSSITSAWYTSNSDTSTINGTSMATPHVAGVAALILERSPNATPVAVGNAIVSNASVDKLTGIGTGSPNLLLYSLVLLSNTAPVASHGGPYNDNEGSAVTFDASGSSDLDADTLTYSWDLGDGSTGSGVSPSHTYADNGTYTVTLSVSDGLATTVATTATIANVVPSVNAGPDATVISGQTFSFSGSFSDPGANDAPWGYVIDWGSMSRTSGSTSDQSLPITTSRQFCATGSYNITLSVTDKDGDTGSDALTLTVPHYVVGMDITPTQNPNPVSLSNKGLLPVAILSTATFNVRDVNPAMVSLGDEAGSDTPVARQQNGRYHTKVEDVNGDGRRDLVLMFEVPALMANGDVSTSSTQLVLRGVLSNGCTNFRGTDSIVVMP